MCLKEVLEFKDQKVILWTQKPDEMVQEKKNLNLIILNEFTTQIRLVVIQKYNLNIRLLILLEELLLVAQI